MRHRKKPVLVWRRRPRFVLGTVLVTESVRNALAHREIRRLLNRHRRGDWGSGYIGRLSPNERFAGYGFRLDSHYRVRGHDVLITTDPVSRETGMRASSTVYLFRDYWEVHGLD